MAVNLQTLLAGFDIQAPAISIEDLVLDSREVSMHKAFVALPGHELDGRSFIPQAISLGAKVIISHTDDIGQHGETEMREHSVIIHFYQLASRLSLLAANFYGFPARDLDVVAVTGTNGKTTTAQLVAQLSQLTGQPAGTIGTVGAGMLDALNPVQNTTPDAISMQRLIRQMQHQGAKLVSLEASSHALVQHRIAALDTRIAVFTNLTRDHLDYHGTMANYAAAKRSLLTQPGLTHAVLNQHDNQSQSWLQECPPGVTPIWYGCDEHLYPGHPFCVATHVEYHNKGARLTIDSSWGQATIESPLIGHFNVLNLLAAVATHLSMGKPLAEIADACQRIQPVAGRMELFSAPGKASAVVDYAHTPDALKQALVAARRHCNGRLMCMFGCGGDRDSGKRPEMGEMAETYADVVMVTNDNSRSEDPNTIVADILAGCQHPDQIQVELNRKKAIHTLLQQATEQDLILLAGKGHEDYQIIGGERLDYNERETIAALLVRNDL